MIMETPEKQKASYVRAKERVRHVKVFYIHLVGYLLFTAFILYNMYIMDSNNEYKETVEWINLTSLTFWTIFIFMHGWKVFKGRILFKRSWEDKKIKEFMDNEKKNQTKLWE